MVRLGLIAALLTLGLIAAPTAQAQAQTPAPQPGVYGAPMVQDPAQTPVQGTPNRGRGWGKWWKRAKCGAAITIVVGSTAFAVSKIAKVKRFIKALGGIKKTAKLLVGATSRREKLAKLGKVGVGAAAYFLSIDLVKENC